MRPGIIGADKQIANGDVECTCSICRGKTFLPGYLYEQHILEAQPQNRAIVYCNSCSQEVVRESTEQHGDGTTVTYYDQNGEKATVSGQWHNLMSRCETVGDISEIPPTEPGKSQAFVGIKDWAPTRTKVQCNRCGNDCYLPNEIARKAVGDVMILCMDCGAEIMEKIPSAKFFGVKYGERGQNN